MLRLAASSRNPYMVTCYYPAMQLPWHGIGIGIVFEIGIGVGIACPLPVAVPLPLAAVTAVIPV